MENFPVTAPFHPGLIPGQHHWPEWPTDPDSSPGQTRMWPGLIKVEVCPEANIMGMTNWFCGMAKITCKSKRYTSKLKL